MVSGRAAPQRRAPRRRRWPAYVLTLVVALVAIFYAAGGFYFSGVVHRDVFEVRPGPHGSTQTAVLTAVSPDTVVVRLDEAYAARDLYAGATVGIRVGSTLVVAGPATMSDGAEVTRPVLDVVGPLPVVGQPAAVQRDVWGTPAELGLAYTEVSITSGADQFPAWVIPATGSDAWAILAHGKHGSRSEMLRMARPLTDAGITCLVVTYTGDSGLAQPPDGLWGYGTVEVPEIEAAVRYAQREGAGHLIMGGASHGAAVVLGFLTRSALAPDVDAAILDSPPADLAANIDLIGDGRTLPVVGLPIPESLEQVATWITQWRYGIDFDDYDYIARADQLSVPMLILQGSADATVAPQLARDLVAAVGPEATLVEEAGAQHVGSWNVDPTGYEAAVLGFAQEHSG